MIDQVELIKRYRKHNLLGVDKVVLSPKFEDAWKSFEVVDFGKESSEKYQGYFLEWIPNVYLLLNEFNKRKYTVFNDNHKQVTSIFELELGVCGVQGIETASPDIYAVSNDSVLLGSCKRDKSGTGALQIRDLVTFKVPSKFSEFKREYMGVSMKKNFKSAKDVDFCIGRESIKDMYECIVKQLNGVGNSIRKLNKKIIKKKKKYEIEPKDAIQKYLMAKIISKIKQYKDVYLDIVMRTGKSYLFAMTVLDIMSGKKRGDRIISVLISHYPTNTFSEFREMFSGSSQFNSFIKLFSDEKKDFTYANIQSALKTKDNVIIVVSAQKLKSDEKLLNLLGKYDIDALGFDEVHNGGNSIAMNDVMDQLNYKTGLFMSGTMDGYLDQKYVYREQVIKWTYFDQRLCIEDGYNKKLDEFTNSLDDIYGDMKKRAPLEFPKLNLRYWDTDQFARLQLEITDSESDESTWKKIYNDQGLLRGVLIESLAGQHISLFGKKKREHSPIKAVGESKMLPMFVPDTTCAKKAKSGIVSLKKEIRDLYESKGLPREKSTGGVLEREVVVCDSTKDNDSIQTFIDNTKDDGKLYIVILVGQGITGISYEDSPVAIIARDISSWTLFQQMIFRVMTPMSWEVERMVFVLSSGQIFSDNMYKFMRSNIGSNNKMEKKFYDCISIYADDESIEMDYRAMCDLQMKSFEGVSSLVSSIASAMDINFGEEFAISLSSNKKTIIGKPSKGKTAKNTNKSGGSSLTEEEKQEKKREKQEKQRRKDFAVLLGKLSAEGIDIVNLNEKSFNKLVVDYYETTLKLTK